jgi:4-hydroxy-L-threonine phosphate dehydrogenase PdxA
MVLANHLFAVALVTTHYPLKMVSSHLTKERIIKSASLFHTFAQKMSPNPKILVCALNPHAGDDGLLGDEEKEIIIPAIVELQKEMDIQGPFAADSLFKLAYLNQAHFFMAMYHDQGLIAVKMLGQNKTVNITLGLPFFRISVDHGTAFDIAGQNKANEESFLTTLKWIFCEKNVIY